MGHIVSAYEVEADLRKIQIMREWLILINLSKLKGFLSVIGYYQRFLKGYKKIVELLTRLLKRNYFNWDEGATDTFEKLKKVMTTILILRMPNFLKEFMVEMDTYSLGLGVVLMQEGCCIIFINKTLSRNGNIIYWVIISR